MKQQMMKRLNLKTMKMVWTLPENSHPQLRNPLRLKPFREGPQYGKKMGSQLRFKIKASSIKEKFCQEVYVGFHYML
jgi:hypothetical protein